MTKNMTPQVKTKKYSFQAKVWKHPSKSAWFFVTLPKELSKTIRLDHGFSEEGWGRLKTTSQIGPTKWNTSMWFDTKHGSYLLPIKSEIRKKEKLGTDSLVKVQLQIEANNFIMTNLR